MLVDPSNYRKDLKSTITNDTLLDDNTKNSSYIMSQIVKINGLKLNLAGPDVKKDPEVVLLALKQNINSSSFISHEYIKNFNISLEKIYNFIENTENKKDDYINFIAYICLFNKDTSYLDQTYEAIEKMEDEQLKLKFYTCILEGCFRMAESGDNDYLKKARNIVEKMRDGSLKDHHSNNLINHYLARAKNGDENSLEIARKIVEKIENKQMKQKLETRLAELRTKNV